MDRRTFLRSAGALSLGAIAWACTKRTEEPQSSGAEALSVVATAQMLAKGDNRNAFALIRGQRPVAPSNVRVRIQEQNGEAIPVSVKKERIARGSGDLEGGEMVGTEVLDIYVFHHAFDPGLWVIDVRVGDEHPGPAAFQVVPDAPEPTIGERAIASQSPTTADHRGVDPICTRTPQCSLHELTIAEALQAGKPTVINFGTPKFCQSRTCGPTLDFVENVAKEFKDRASFVHVEVFRSEQVANTETGDSPTFHEWKLGTEPWTYFVGADGVIKDRWLGSIGEDELRSAVSKLVKG